MMRKLLFILMTITILMVSMSLVTVNKTVSIQNKNIVIISTQFGEIKILLYDKTPLHRDNFIKLTKDGYLDGALFHRVIKNFVIQGGDPDSKKAKTGDILGNGGPGYEIPAEFVPEYIHKRGALGAARESDDVNPQKKSSGSQFYIVVGKKLTDDQLNKIEEKYKKKFSDKEREIYKNLGGVPHLDGNYTVFGEVIEGMDVVDKIAVVKTDSNDRPVDDIKMTVRIVN